MTFKHLTSLRARFEWATLIPALAPFVAYAVIMLLVLAFGE